MNMRGKLLLATHPKDFDDAYVLDFDDSALTRSSFPSILAVDLRTYVLSYDINKFTFSYTIAYFFSEWNC